MAEKTDEGTARKGKPWGLILGLVLFLVGAGGGFFIMSGMLGAKPESAKVEPKSDHKEGDAFSDIAFIPIDPMVVSLGPSAEARHLRFRAQLEVPSAESSTVETLMPRVVDTLNSYLQAVDESDFESKAALLQIRTQMLHRIKLVLGKERVNDLLVMEFVLS